MVFTLDLLQDIRKEAFAKNEGYPYLVALLKDAWVRSYYVTMRTYTVIYTLTDWSELIEHGQDDAIVWDVFNEKALVDALRAHQRWETDFVTRLNATREAGCIDYIADLEKMIVIYRGNGGEYVESIPEITV